MFKRDSIIHPFTRFKELPFPHEVSRGFVKLYATGLDTAAAVYFLEVQGYKLTLKKRADKETQGAMHYTKTVGRFVVAAVYNANDKSMLLAAERKK